MRIYHESEKNAVIHDTLVECFRRKRLTSITEIGYDKENRKFKGDTIEQTKYPIYHVRRPRITRD